MTLINSQDQKNFERDGVVCLRSIIPKESISHLASAINQLFDDVGLTPTGYDLESLGDIAYSDSEDTASAGMAKQYDLDLMAGMLQYEGDRRLIDKVPDKSPKGSYRIDTGCWRRNNAVATLALSSVLPEIAADLLQSQSIAFFDDQMFVKTPGTRQRTAFHQDYPFFHIEGMQGCVFWIPVDAASSKNGAMSYVRGSHKWEEDFGSSMFVSHTPMPGSTGARIPDIEANPEAFDLVSFDVWPGDVVVHHFRTLHGAGGNRTIDNNRRVMSLRYVGDDMRYKFRPGAARQPHHYHDLRDGDLLFCDDFPQVWPVHKSEFAAQDKFDFGKINDTVTITFTATFVALQKGYKGFTKTEDTADKTNQ